jgi:hypothetical protein
MVASVLAKGLEMKSVVVRALYRIRRTRESLAKPLQTLTGPVMLISGGIETTQEWHIIVQLHYDSKISCSSYSICITLSVDLAVAAVAAVPPAEVRPVRLEEGCHG